VARCQHGDTAAFNELVTRYRGKVYAMIYNMVHNEQDAWDLAQDGFLKAWKSIGRFRGQSSFYTWLYRIMMNVTIDSLRRKQVGGETEFDDSIGLRNIDPGSVTTPRTGALPEDKITGDEIRARIDAAVQRLTPEHRAVILMRETPARKCNPC
jgi:RNA polymerase sigma-70 factor (ECF subfamily)